MLHRLPAVLYMLLLLKSATAQTSLLQDTLQQVASRKTIALYSQALDKEAGLYNGREYIRYGAGYIGDAYFNINDWQNATICYDSMTYYNVPALYDLVKDELIIKHFNGVANISLVKQKVAQFTLAGHTFVRIEPDSANSSTIQTGFYDKLYEGKTMVLAKRVKSIEEYTVGQQIETRFDQSNNYYLKKDSVYYPVKKARYLFNVLKDKKKETQQYLRKNKIKFKKDPENALVKAAAYYDSLKK